MLRTVVKERCRNKLLKQKEVKYQYMSRNR